MTKWLSYLFILAILIATVILSISGSKASFLLVVDVSKPYKSCSVVEKYSETRYHSTPIQPFPITKERLPKDLNWQNGNDAAIFSSQNAKQGGTYNKFIQTFPQTFRQVGVNANSSFREQLDVNDMGLVEYNPISKTAIPALATDWAFSKDQRTVYYKLDKDARWSDGVPVTADDYVFALKFHRTEGIVAAWYNVYYTEQIEAVLKFDDYTIAVRLPSKKPLLQFSAGISPYPYHFFGNFRKETRSYHGKQAYTQYKIKKSAIPNNLLYFKLKEQLVKLEEINKNLQIALIDSQKNNHTITNLINNEFKPSVSKIVKTLKKLGSSIKINYAFSSPIQKPKMVIQKLNGIVSGLNKVTEKHKFPTTIGLSKIIKNRSKLDQKSLVTQYFTERMIIVSKLKEQDNTNPSKLDFTTTSAQPKISLKTDSNFQEILEKDIKHLKAQIKEITTVKIEVLDVCKNWNKTYNWKARPNTGPYQLSRFMHGKWLEMSRCTHWWADQKKYYKNRFNPAKIRYHLITSADIAFEYFKQHEIDFFGLTSSKFWYKKAMGLKIFEKGYVKKRWLWNIYPRPSYLVSMNVLKKDLGDKNIRLGINHALNIKKMIDIVMLGDAEQASSITSGVPGFTNTEIKARMFDVEKSIKYFETAGWTEMGSDGIRIKNGKRLSYNLIYMSEFDKPKLLVLKNEATKCGLELNLETFDTNTVFEYVQQKKHELVWHGWGPANILFGPQYRGQYHMDNSGKPNNNNFTNMKNEIISKKINAYRLSTSIKDKQILAKELQQDIYDEASAFPTIVIPYQRDISWRWIIIPEVAETPNCYSLLDSNSWWIDEEIKKETLEAIKSGKSFPKVIKTYDKYKLNK